MEVLRSADLLVLNGEGTLHHGAVEGERLLRAADYASSEGKPLALINTIYQENPPEWAERSQSITLISTRDRFSLEAARKAGLAADYAPDLSLYRRAAKLPSETRIGVAYGDSVFRRTSQDLYEAFCRAEGVKLYLPVRTSIKHAGISWPLTASQRVDNLRYSLWWRLKMLSKRGICLTSKADDYLDCLSGVGLYLTGRYHAVCFSLVSETPFRAISSNSHKIEALLKDVGINPKRLVRNVDELASSKPNEWQFSSQEKRNIEAFLGDARNRIDGLFDRVAALSR